MTLVEVLVALALGMFVIGTVAAVFAGTSRNRGDLERSDRLAENVQYATELIGDELRLAGYFAETDITGVAWQAPDPCAISVTNLGFRVAPFNLPHAVVGYAATEIAPVCLQQRRANTPAVVVRRLAVETTPPASANGAAFVQISKCTLDLQPWRIGDRTSDFTLRNLDCVTPADIRRVIVRAYYIADCNECGLDTTPTLKRVELVDGTITNPPTPLVEGIENLNIEYGFDIDGDGDADRFLIGLSGAAGAPDNDWANVVGIRVNVLARATDPDPGYRDTTKQYNLGAAGYAYAGADNGYKRTLASTIVRLNNPSMRRETP